MGSPLFKMGDDRDTDLSRIPYDLKHYGKERLAALSHHSLMKLCQDRGLPTSPPNTPAIVLLQRLLEWKDQLPPGQRSAPPPQPPRADNHKAPAKVVSSEPTTPTKKATSKMATGIATPPPTTTTTTTAVASDFLPYDLAYVGETKLLKMELARLQEVARHRGIPSPQAPEGKEAWVAAILAWKKSQHDGNGGKHRGEVKASSPPPPPPPQQDGAAVVQTPGAPSEEAARPGRALAPSTNGQKPAKDPSALFRGYHTSANAASRGATPTPITPITNGALVSLAGLVVITHNIKDFSINNKSLAERIENLQRSYQDEAFDVLVIQECQQGNEPTEQLASSLSAAGGRSRRQYQYVNSPCIGDKEVASFIFNSDKLSFVECQVGIPINASSSLIKRGFAQPLEPSFAELCGFPASELHQHTYQGAADKDLFIRQPVYCVFQSKETQALLVICSVHLHSDPSDELRYAGDLLPRDPDSLWRDRYTLFMLCGDMNLTKSSTEARMEQPIHGPNEGKYSFALPPPFRDHTTNLGKAFLAEGGSDQCYDNYIIPKAFESRVRTKVLPPPGGFIDSLVKALNGVVEEEGGAINTRGRKDKAAYHAFMLFSDHRPLRLRINV